MTGVHCGEELGGVEGVEVWGRDGDGSEEEVLVVEVEDVKFVSVSSFVFIFVTLLFTTCFLTPLAILGPTLVTIISSLTSFNVVQIHCTTKGTICGKRIHAIASKLA